MNLAKFVAKNALRNKRRTLLTVLSIGFSLFLLIMLQTFMKIFSDPTMDSATALRLVTTHKASIFEGMPIAYVERIRKVPGVQAILPMEIYGGIWKDPKNFFGNIAVDPDSLFDMFPEVIVTPETKQAFREQRTGAVCGVKLMNRFDWKVGDVITLIGTVKPADLELKIIGTYTSKTVDEASMYLRFDYLNEALGSPDRVSALWIRAATLEAIPQICQDIDKMFANSPAETRTETEKAFLLGFMGMLGNIKLMMGSIVAVVVFTMLLVTASTMATTIRERLREIAILKAMGFPRMLVLGLTIGEAIFIAFLGGLVGCACAFGMRFVDLYSLTQGFIPFFPIRASTLISAVLIGMAVGLLSSLIPAIKGANMPITSALRQLE